MPLYQKEFYAIDRDGVKYRFQIQEQCNCVADFIELCNADMNELTEIGYRFISASGTIVTDEAVAPSNTTPNATPPATSSNLRICPVHNAIMELRNGRGGDTWYSHKWGNEWCRGGT